MALTPEDVVKKQFSKPKGFGGRNGYDDNQVDDFLDEVVAELRRLNSENESLADQLEDCRRGVKSDAKGGDTSGVKTTTAAAVPALTPVSGGKSESAEADKQEIERLRRELEEAKKAADTPASGKGDDKVLAELRKKADDSAVALDVSLKRVSELEKELAACKNAQTTSDHTSEDAASVISLAQRLHDEHVHAGEVERDRLIAEAKKQHDELIRTGTEKSTSMIADAENRRDNLLSDLEKQHTSIRAEIERLKGIEIEYRTHLKNYLTEEIKHLDASPKAPVVETKN